MLSQYQTYILYTQLGELVQFDTDQFHHHKYINLTLRNTKYIHKYIFSFLTLTLKTASPTMMFSFNQF